MTAKLRVLILTHEDMLPPADLVDNNDPRLKECRTEVNVRDALIKLDHEVELLGIEDNIGLLRKTIEAWQPDIVFNLMEAFAYNGALDYYIVSYLNMLRIPYTGCNPRGLILARDKALSKKLLCFHRIRVPKFKTFAYGQKINRRQLSKLPYPMIVKSMYEQGSVGISQASIVNNDEELMSRVGQMHGLTTQDVIAEQYIEGRELYITVMGNQRLQTFPIREITFDHIDDKMHRIATYNVKWNDEYRKRWGIKYQFARHLPNGMEDKIIKLAKRVYRLLDLTGYARLDLRLTAEGELYVLEINPNAAIANNDDVAHSAEKAGLNYEQLIQRVLNLGLIASKST